MHGMNYYECLKATSLWFNEIKSTIGDADKSSDDWTIQQEIMQDDASGSDGYEIQSLRV
jgi:hypothetical protein